MLLDMTHRRAIALAVMVSVLGSPGCMLIDAAVRKKPDSGPIAPEPLLSCGNAQASWADLFMSTALVTTGIIVASATNGSSTNKGAVLGAGFGMIGLGVAWGASMFVAGALTKECRELQAAQESCMRGVESACQKLRDRGAEPTKDTKPGN